jgi:rubrerythrin
MDIYSFALQMKKNGEEYYRELANKSGSEGLKKILTMLAEEEVKHFQLIEKMRKKVLCPRSSMPKVLTAAKNIFLQVRDGIISKSIEQDCFHNALFPPAGSMRQQPYR